MRFNYPGQLARIKCEQCSQPMLGVGEQDPHTSFFTAGTGFQFCDCPDTSTERVVDNDA